MPADPRLTILRVGVVFRVLLAMALLVLALQPARAVQEAARLRPTIILISFDGFRWDYIDMAETPNLDRLVANGVRAGSLIPSFPTKTFPNHYTIVTGLYPDHHGVVANNMYDPEFDARFSLGDRDAVADARWYGGEPIWVTAEKQGQITATFFWPGTAAAIGGVRPTHWRPYDGSVPNSERVARVLEWIRLPEDERPTFLSLYFSDVDDLGHEFGAESPEVIQGIAQMDSLLGQLLQGLDEDGVTAQVNFIVTSDHGMTDVDPEHVIVLDDYIDLSVVDIVDRGPVLAVRPAAGREREVYENLAGVSGMSLYWKSDIPERLHYSDHRRITPIVGIADEGWTITTAAALARRGVKTGHHGYDNALLSQHGTFIASGPAFRSGIVVEPIENIEIYNIMAHILGLEPAPNDGDLDRVRHMLSN